MPLIIIPMFFTKFVTKFKRQEKTLMRRFSKNLQNILRNPITYVYMTEKQGQP